MAPGPSIVDLGYVGPAANARSRPMATRIRRSPSDSPVTSIRQVLKAVVITVLVVTVLGAKGIIQTARGMGPGSLQSATLTVGNIGLGVEQLLHVTFAWDDLQAALGHPQQSGVPPLLRIVPTPPSPRHHTTKPTRGHGGTHRGVPPKGGKTGKSGHKLPRHHVHWPPLPRISKSRPLNILITGDSLTGYMGPQIINEASAEGPVVGTTDTHDGTGLTTPAFLDWSLLAQQQVRKFHPMAIVIMMGGNDFENMTLPPSPGHKNGQFFTAGTPSWTREYERRAAYVMRVWIRGGVRRVYWLSMPPAQDPSWAHDDRKINVALKRAAAKVPGVHYVNVLGPILNHGHYTNYVNVNGQPELIREPDGVHLNVAGSQIVTNEVVPIIKREWHFGWSQVRARRHPHHRLRKSGSQTGRQRSRKSSR